MRYAPYPFNVSLAQRDSLKGLEFCHEHRVAHCDILEQNIVLDVLIPERTIGTLKNVTGSESRFAFIDFGLATVIPYTMALEDAPLRTDIIFERRAGLGSRRPCNPFVVDVMSIGSLMQRLIRVCCLVVPRFIVTEVLHSWRQMYFQRVIIYWTR